MNRLAALTLLGLGQRCRLRVGCAAIVISTAAVAAASAAPPPGARAMLQAIKHLPLAHLPASVRSGIAAERGTLTFKFPVLGRVMTAVASAESNSTVPVGTLVRQGSALVFRFTALSYSVAPIKLPNGLEIGPQTIKIDRTHTSTIRVSLATGAVTRDLHWRVQATNTRYNGSPAIELADQGLSRFVALTKLGTYTYRLHILTVWKNTVRLTSWTVAGKSLPPATVNITANWNGYYRLNLPHY